MKRTNAVLAFALSSPFYGLKALYDAVSKSLPLPAPESRLSDPQYVPRISGIRVCGLSFVSEVRKRHNDALVL